MDADNPACLANPPADLIITDKYRNGLGKVFQPTQNIPGFRFHIAFGHSITTGIDHFGIAFETLPGVSCPPKMSPFGRLV
jgi:hypothetical protein